MTPYKKKKPLKVKFKNSLETALFAKPFEYVASMEIFFRCFVF